MTEARSAGRRLSELQRRIASAVVMIAGALLAAWAGGLVFAAFWIIAGVAVGCEWAWLSAREPAARRLSARLAGVTLGTAGAMAALAYLLPFGIWPIVATLLVGGGLVAFAGRPAPLVGFSVPYGAAVFLGAILLRRDPEDGLLAILWLFAVVWSTDIAAFFVGRALRGPKLAPSVSPNKTWSGALGGALAGTIAGTAVAAAGGETGLLPVVAISFFAAVLAEWGDLLESGVKRAFGAKDSSRLIPGHGGLMDRLDGFLVAATFAAAIGVARGGFDAAGQGLLRW